MKDLPQAIKAQLEQLKKIAKFRLSLKVINNRYYVYEETGEWLKDRKQSRTISKYIGRITENGSFLKKKIRHDNEIEKAEALITEKGGQVLWNKKNVRKESKIYVNNNIDEIDRKLLMILSMNGRATLSFMGDQIGLTVQATYRRIKRLEEKYGIKYILDLRREKLGYNRFLGFIKFSERIPSITELRAVLSKYPKINFAAITNGAYDVVFYLTEETSDKAVDIIWKMESQSLLKNYNAEWTITPISSNYGYMPIGDEFLETLKEKVWHRTRENRALNPGLLTEREFNVIKELNNNGSLNFTNIDKKLNFAKGTASYTYEKLEEKGIIKRTTITMEKLPIKYVAVILLKYTNSEEYEKTRKEFLREIIQYNSPTNKYTIEGDIGSPHSIVLFYPILKEGELDQTMEEIKSRIRGVTITSLIISTILVGSLCYRLFDNDYSRQHDILTEMKVIKSTPIVRYKNTQQLTK